MVCWISWTHLKRWILSAVLKAEDRQGWHAREWLCASTLCALLGSCRLQRRSGFFGPTVHNYICGGSVIFELGGLQVLVSAKGSCCQQLLHWWRRLSKVIRREHRFWGPALQIHVPSRAVVTSGMHQRDRGGGGHGPVQKSYHIRQHTLPSPAPREVADGLQIPCRPSRWVLPAPCCAALCVGRSGWLLYCQQSAPDIDFSLLGGKKVIFFPAAEGIWFFSLLPIYQILAWAYVKNRWCNIHFKF